MVDTLSATLRTIIKSTYTQGLDLVNTPDGLSLTRTQILTTGTGLDQGNVQWHDQRVISASSSDTIDLADASNAIKDAFGNSLNLDTIKFIFIRNVTPEASPAEIQIDPTVSNGWTTAIAGITKIPTTGWFCMLAPNAAGFNVTAGTNDQLKITNNDGSNAATYEIVIIGNKV